MPAAPMSSSTPSTACTGASRKARSAGSGRSRRLGTPGRPKALVALGWTAMSGPVKPVMAVLWMISRAQPELSDAPTMAMLFGAKKSRSRGGVTRLLEARWLAARRAGSVDRSAIASARHARLFGQAQGALADDVALDLAGPGVDGAGPAGQEHALPGGDRVVVAVRPQQGVRALDVHGQLAELLVVLAPEQLGHRGFRPRRTARGQRGQRAQAAEAHQLDLGVGPGQALPDQRVGDPAALAGGLDQFPELALEAEVGHGGAAAAFVAERGHGHPPAVGQATDDVDQRGPDVVQKVLAELGRPRQLLDGPVLDPGAGEVEQDVGQAAVFLGLGGGPAQDEYHVGPGRARGPHLLPADHDLVALDHAPGLDRGQIGAVVGLGEGPAVDVPAGDDAVEEVGPLR